jgi:hypothetical protein
VHWQSSMTRRKLMLSPTGRAPTAFHERSRWGRRDPYSVKEQPLDRDHDRDPSDWRNRCSPASCWRRARRSRRVQTPKRAESTHVAQAHGSAYVEHVRSGRPDPAERRRRTQGSANKRSETSTRPDPGDTRARRVTVSRANDLLVQGDLDLHVLRPACDRDDGL